MTSLPLPPTITTRLIPTPPLTTHILESGAPSQNSPTTPRKPLILLLHGFPELAYSWRKVLPQLASAGYHVVAPDARGFGRTTGWDTRPYDTVDLNTFTGTSLVRDVVRLVYALGYTSVACVVGHDAGAVTAAMCAVSRPDLFRGVVLLSHPFGGVPKVPFDVESGSLSVDEGKGPEKEEEKEGGGSGRDTVHEDLLALGRKHYKWYYSTEAASREMENPAGGMHAFLRGYFHVKSGAWEGNQPEMLSGWTAEELARMPYYYIMPAEASMPEAVEMLMRGASESGVERCREWLSEEELGVYVAEYARTGFQGALNWYRVRTAEGGKYTWDWEVYAGRKIDIPCAFVSGRQDWGIYQEPGALEKMRDGTVCSNFRELRLVDGVGHWAPQESPEVVVEVILGLVKGL
ncbi:alpha/beta fold hydrolase [Aspergillus ibericus CBS 121593]|uniref:Alpha/beta-hydrolase n=1 Tax=Aspergillus ibericus CBS 121593 TaxID=1448316 RepID=A0A395GTS7_9EURO|nr:alpha/beta-hydrolase [Aspergillus ibericus CBS 121593]RAK98846.1 alpha/beta-hydrolase [Aspergillus ibericus CBS 121593]